MTDTLKTIGTSMGTIIVNVWELVPETLGVLLIILNILMYISLNYSKIKPYLLVFLCD